MEPLFAHQKAIARKCWHEAAVAIFSEQGTGKTRAVLEALHALQAWPALVICPTTVTSVWQREARQWCAVDTIVVRGSKPIRERQLKHPTARLFIINYECLRTYSYEEMPKNPVTGRRYHATRNRINDMRAWATVIADESSKIKHHASKQSKAVHAFGNVPRRYILSGTSITHSPLDLYSQFKFLVPTLFKSWTEFQSHYAEIVPRPMPYGSTSRFTTYNEVVGYRNLPELYERVRPYIIQYKKEDCLDLPEKVYQTIPIEMVPEQKKAYTELLTEFITEISGTVIIGANVLTRLLRLQQICQGEQFTPNPKLVAVTELLERITGKVIIWCRFRADIETLSALCTKLNLPFACIYGDVPQVDRGEIIERFQVGDTRVMIAQIDTAGFGITLTAATYSIYYSQNFNLDSRQQSEDRNHRIGTTQKCTYIDLVCEGTVDETIRANLQSKKLFQGEFDATRFAAAAKGEV